MTKTRRYTLIAILFASGCLVLTASPAVVFSASATFFCVMYILTSNTGTDIAVFANRILSVLLLFTGSILIWHNVPQALSFFVFAFVESVSHIFG